MAKREFWTQSQSKIIASISISMWEDDVVSIVRRKRGAPLDKIVAELMIWRIVPG